MDGTRLRPRSGPRLELASRLQFVPGIGPARALAYERLGLTTVEHLVRHYPRIYLDARHFVRVKDLRPGELLTVVGAVKSAAALRTRAGRTDFVAAIDDGSGTVSCYFFGQPFLAKSLSRGVRVVVSGEFDAYERRMINPLFEIIEGEVEELLHAGRLVPVHSLTRGLSARGMRRAVRVALEGLGDRIPDPIPSAVAVARQLAPLPESLRQIHFPDDNVSLAQARRRLAFEELLLLQTVMELRRRAFNEEGRGLCSAGPGRLAQGAERALPFALTADQRTALAEIVADMRREHPMQRLLLGDVGSGKTVVAYLAALFAIESGHQVAFMAPTEILAHQHAATLAAWASAVDVSVVGLTGGSSGETRRKLAARLEAGQPMLVVGTHALLEEKVKLPRLGLAIVDEQHRFGVRQRAVLAQKGIIPDVLVLTATPIPRTLTLTYFGDLEVSRLASRPPGRGRLVTRVTGEEKSLQVLEFLGRELGAGRQGFVVVPAIEETSGQAQRAAEAEYRRLSTHPLLKPFRVGLLHGRLKSDEKQEVMARFASGEIHVLVTTTVVEVGVDVPNATVMVVENAERFGLTQLHQLRGRVGRGSGRSVCVLVRGPGAGSLAIERLAVLGRTDNGFEIAEADLKLRGPGEPWGIRQSGMPRLKLADLRDEALLEEARTAARAIVARDPWLMGAEHAILKSTLLAQYQEPLALALGG